MAAAVEMPTAVSADLQEGIPRAPMCGWLLKRKSEGARSRILSDTNRRYFTLDYNTQVFFYAHSEGKKQVSYPIPFHDILSVGPLFASADDSGDGSAPAVQRSNSKTSITSKLSVFGSKQKEQHGFVLKTPGKDLELLCASPDEAARWIAALSEVAQGGKAVQRCGSIGERSTTPGSNISGCDGLDLPEGPPEEPALPEPRAKRAACKMPPRPPAAPSPRPDNFAAPKAEEAVARLDRVAEVPVAFAPQESEKSEPAPAPAPEAFEVVETVEICEQPIAAAAEPEHAPDMVADMSGKLDIVQDVGQNAWGSGKLQTMAGAPRYSDKNEGLSLQQRLQQLDFSDDEDEEDEAAKPQPKEFAGAGACEAGAGKPEPQSSVEVEACQAFTAPDSDTD